MSTGFKIVLALIVLIAIPAYYILLKGPDDPPKFKEFEKAKVEAVVPKHHAADTGEAPPPPPPVAANDPAAPAPAPADPAAPAPAPAPATTEPAPAPAPAPAAKDPTATGE